MAPPDWFVWVVFFSTLGGLLAFFHYAGAALVNLWRWLRDLIDSRRERGAES